MCTPSFPTKFIGAVSLPTLHRQLGHLGSSVLQFLQSHHFITSSSNKVPLSHACELGKHYRLSFSSSLSKTTRMFELIHSDLWTSLVTSLSGFKYYFIS